MKKVLMGLLVTVLCSAASAETIGEINTAFKFGGSDKVITEVYDDPMVAGVSCYVSRPKTGGVSGRVGLAEDKSDASISCVQVGPISFKGPIPQQEDAFSARLSILFKTMHVTRMVDRNRNVLVYMTTSSKLIDGSPKTSVAAIVVPRNVPIPVR